MNHRPSGLPSPKTGVEGFLYYKIAEGLSHTTLVNYQYKLELWISRLGDAKLEEVTSSSLARHMAWLRTEYVPIRKNGDKSPLSGKTLRNHWVTLKSFFAWLDLEFDAPNPMTKIPPPKFTSPEVNPLTKEEIARLAGACNFTREASTSRRRPFVIRRTTARRDLAIVMTLLDTGLRAGEFCSLNIGDLDMKTGRLEVKHGPVGGAKGGKGRVVFIGRKVRRLIWRYLIERTEKDDNLAPLFVTNRSARMTPNSLLHLVKSLSKKSGVEKCYPHRFRHTFAITYLRAGGDLLTLQALLGHQSLEMVRRYARIAEIDLARAHRQASPVDNMGL